MNTRDIVRKAWQITQVHLKKLIWYGSIPAFFSIVVSTIYLIYQYHAFKTSALFSDQAASSTEMVETAKTVWSLITGHPTASIILLVTAIFFLIGYTVIPPIFHGVLIYAITRITQYETMTGSVERGVRRFFPMFEFGLLTGAFSITTLFTEGSFILRWWGEGVFFVALPILLFIAIVGFIISFLFTYSEFYIVLKGKGPVRAIMDSTVLVISNLRKTFLVVMLMVLISVRIILNVILVLMVPMAAVLAGSYFAVTLWSTAGVIVVGTVSFIALLVSSYLFGLFHIFAITVWVLTFNVLTERDSKPIEDEALEEG